MHEVTWPSARQSGLTPDEIPVHLHGGPVQISKGRRHVCKSDFASESIDDKDWASPSVSEQEHAFEGQLQPSAGEDGVQELSRFFEAVHGDLPTR